KRRHFHWHPEWAAAQERILAHATAHPGKNDGVSCPRLPCHDKDQPFDFLHIRTSPLDLIYGALPCLAIPSFFNLAQHCRSSAVHFLSYPLINMTLPVTPSPLKQLSGPAQSKK